MAGEVTQAFLNDIEAGIDAAFAKLDQLYQLEAYAEKLPIIGTTLSTAANALQSLTLLRDAIRGAVDQVSNLADLATRTTAQVQSELNSRLSTALGALTGQGYFGTVSTNVDSSGNVTINLDSGRTTNYSFTPGDLGMSGLNLTLQGTATAQLAYNFDLRLGRDSTGFFLDTAGSDLSLGAKVSLNNLSASAQLGPLRFMASNIPDSDPAAGADTLSLNLGTIWNQTGKIRAFTTDLLDFRATGDVDLDIHLAADMGTAALPSINADLHVDWNFSNNIINGSGANNWNSANISFTGVEYDFGSFVENTIRPILDQLVPILGPINTALAVFRTDISGVLLPEWAALLDVVPDPAPGHQVTLLDFLQLAANASGQTINLAPLAGLIDTLDRIVDFAEFFSGRTFSDDAYQIGNWQYVLQDIQGAANTLSTVNVAAGFTSTAQNVTQFLDNLVTLGRTGYIASHNGAIATGSTGANLIASLVGDPTLSFPLLEDPKNVIRLLLGQDIDFFKLDLPAINIALGMDVNGNVTNPVNVLALPIWPFPLVTAKLGVAAQAVIDLAFGWDTSGLRQYALGGFQNPLLVFDGFYFDDQRSGGNDIAEVIVRAAIDFVIDANFVGVSIGGGGNLIGELVLDLADSVTTPEGKLYVGDLPSGFPANLFSIFDVSGKLTAGLRGYVNSPLGNIWSYNSPRVTLATFNNVQDAAPAGPPPGLAGFVNGTELWVNVGNRAGLRTIANTTDGAEVVDISNGVGGALIVAGFDVTQIFTGATTIQVDANAGADEIVIAPDVAIAARITGGAGADYLQGGAAADQIYGGTEDDYLRGSGGADQLYGEDGNDYLEGGEGADQLFGGAGIYDFATYANSAAGVTLNLTTGIHGGDAAGDSFDGIEIFEGSAHADNFTGTANADILSTLAGNDVLNGMGGDDTLAGGSGTNTIDGGDGFDIVNYFNLGGPVSVNITGTGGTATAAGLSDTLSNVEQIDGSVHGDTMIGGAGNQIFVGREGNDTLNGGADNDTLVGGIGADILIGGDGIDRASYIFATAGVTVNLATGGTGGEATGDTYAGIENVRGSQFADTITGDAGANYLFGAEGNDTLNGGDGEDVLEGGIGADSLNGGANFDRATYLLSASAVTLNLATGVHTGDAAGDTFASVEIYQGTNQGDVLLGSTAGEQLWGELGDDELRGAGGNDTLLGGGGNDLLYGDAGLDIIEGGEGSDTLHGGEDADTLLGDAGADTLNGDAGGDVLSGGADNDIVSGGTGNDSLSGGDGDDTLRGDEDHDALTGGTGNDLLRGGAGNDLLIGDAGQDTLDGGEGRDKADYTSSIAGVYVNLSTSNVTLGGVSVTALSARDGFGSIDWIDPGADNRSSVEDARGSGFDDYLYASENGSLLEGMGGNDVLFGIGGGDTLKGGAGNDAIDGLGGDDTIMGGAGNDTLAGGSGNDLLSYEEDSGAGVTASLATNTATDGSGGQDTLSQFENLRGSQQGDTLTGDGNVNLIEGLGGDDVIDGGLGGDILRGGAGNDIIVIDGVGSGGDNVDDSEGYDLIRSSVDTTNNGVPWALAEEDLQLIGGARIGYGNADNNLLMGNALDNELDGLSGSDTFWGYAGNDVYVFDSLGDAIGVGTAFRALTSGDGEVAGGGTDTIRLATANIYGGTFQNPTVWTYTLAQSGFEHVEGLVLTDDARRVDLTGNARDNLLVGNSHGQILIGAEGNDILDPATGIDDVRGGAGNDTLRLNWSATTDYDFNISGLAGTLAGGYSGALYNNAQLGNRNRVDFSGIEHFDIRLGQGHDTLRVGDGNDRVSGEGGNDYIVTGQGFDVIDGGSGIDRWVADKSAATAGMAVDLRSGLWTYEIAGGTGSVTGIEILGVADAFSSEGYFQTGSGGDTITTHTGHHDDHIATNGGNDRVTIFAGIDTIDMGAGTDTLVIDWSAIPDYVINVSGLAGSLADGYFGQLYNNAQLNSRNRVNFAGVEHFDVRLGQQGDTLRVGDGNDRVFGEGGDDYILTGKGYDVVDGGAGGADRWVADKSAATANMTIDLRSGLWTYDIAGGIGSVTGIEVLGVADAFVYEGYFQTGSGNDTITTFTTHLDDHIATNGGNDRVTVFAGIDTVDLGAGNDTLVVDWSAVTDYVFNQSGLTGTFVDGYAGQLFNNAQTSDRNRVNFGGVEHFDIRLGQQGDTLRVGDGNDRVFGEGGDDYILTGKGFDVVDGGAGTADRWVADKSAATANMTIDLRSGLWTYDIAGGTGSVTGIEVLGVADAFVYEGYFQTGSGNDTITTFTTHLDDHIATNGGNDRVTVFAGIDTVDLGAGNDTLVVDWSAVTDYVFNQSGLTGTFVDGYAGQLFNNAQTSDRNRVNFGGVEHFDIRLGQQGDTLRVGDGNDRVFGEGGDDYILTGKGFDVVDGGAGTADRWVADKSAATAAMTIDLRSGLWTYDIAGGTGSVTGIEILGVAAGFSYEAYFQTGAFGDTITTHSSHQSDYIATNGGDDRVTIFAGIDTIDMGAGNDILVIDWSNITDYSFNISTLNGAAADGYAGEIYNNAQLGSRNRVNFNGVERFDVKLGAGDDLLRTGDNDDIVAGGGGNDHLITGRGADTIDGGGGTADRWEADKSNATTAQAIAIDLTQTLQSTYFGGATVRGIEALSLSTGAGDDSIVTLASHFTDVLTTGAGNDIAKVAGGIDSVVMGDGFDTLVIDWSYVTDYDFNIATFNGTFAGGYNGALYNNSQLANFNRVDWSGVERFDIATGSGNDTVQTGDADDRVASGGGNDYLLTRGGADVVDGGAGVDRWWADKSAATTAIMLDLNAAAPQSYVVGGVTGSVTGIEVLGSDLRFLTGSGNDIIVTHASFLNDVIGTGTGDDTVTVKAGIDSIEMGGGNDLLIVDWSNVTGYDFNIASLGGNAADGYGGALYNNAQLSNRNRIDFSGVERFDIATGDGNDTIRGGDNADRLRGGAGNDGIYAGKGADVIDGGAGADLWNGNQADYTGAIAIDLRLVGLQATFGASTVSNIEALELTTGSGNDTIITHTAFYNDVVVTGDGDDTITLFAGIDNITGGGGTDRLVIDWSTIADYDINITTVNGTVAAGHSGEFYHNAQLGNRNRVNYSGIERFDLSFGSGNDTMRSGDGDDVLRGNGGNDYLEARGGNDFLDGGIGNDALHGGTGNDIYIVDSAGDTVNEAAASGTDEVRTALAAYTLAAHVENLTGTGTAGQTLVGNALDNVITGSAFDDLLTGGDGNDTIGGGEGNDQIIFGKGANDQVNGGGGTDTLVLEGYVGNYEFTDMGGGVTRVRDLRDPANATTFITAVERVNLANGNYTIAQALAGTIAGPALSGTTGSDTVTAPTPGATLDLSQGGNDTATGSTGNEVFYFGGAMTGGDRVDGGAGANDQIGIRGDYTGGNALVFGATTITNVESLAALPGFSYSITTHDANVAPGQRLIVYAGQLGAFDNFTFNGAAENDGRFLVYAGRGIDSVTTGGGNDGIYFGPGNFNPTTDVVNAGAGGNDQVGLDGDYTITVTTANFIGVEVIALLPGLVDDPGRYTITIADNWIDAGQQKVVSGTQVTTALTIDGSAETNGSLRILAGTVGDRLTGTAGADFIFGGGGADVITGGGGADLFFYDYVSDSTGENYDRLLGFEAIDKISVFGLTVTGVDATVTSGSLSTGSIDAGLTAALGAAQLGANRAVVFTPTAGTLSGSAFLVIDGNGIAGYQAGQDLVIELVGASAVGLGQFV